MILAGIDEAGYGPMLGPLVVGCCAFEAPGEIGADLPCLWRALKKIVSKDRVRSGRKLHINDSKKVYSPAVGLKELERSVLAVATAWQDWSPSLEGFLGRVSAHVTGELADYAWYAPPAGERFPAEQDDVAVRLFANGLKSEMARANCRCVHLGARVVLERQFNRMVDETRNKADALFSLSAIHIQHLLEHFGTQNLVIFCDRQGGRGYYGSLLRLMFDSWSLQILSETEGRSEYRLGRAGHFVRIIFCEKAEEQCMSVALASMLSKYLREMLMGRLNAYWRSHLPELKPTAGYYGDGARFLEDIAAKRQEMGVRDEDLIRSR